VEVERRRTIGVYLTSHSKKRLMGKKVRVFKTFVRRSMNHRYWDPVPCLAPKIGWVVGFRSLQNGVLRPGGDGEMPYLASVQRVPCMLVAFSPSRSPQKVPLDAFEVL